MSPQTDSTTSPDGMGGGGGGAKVKEGMEGWGEGAMRRHRVSFVHGMEGTVMVMITAMIVIAVMWW